MAKCSICGEYSGLVGAHQECAAKRKAGMSLGEIIATRSAPHPATPTSPAVKTGIAAGVSAALTFVVLAFVVLFVHGC